MPRQQQVTVLPGALKAWRRERGLSQSGLAAKCPSLSEGLIAQIETGRRQPGLTNAIELAKGLGLDDVGAIAFVHVTDTVGAFNAVKQAAVV